MLSQYACGHTGRENEPGWRIAKAAAFIRVAEARGKPVTVQSKPCPDCRAS